MMTSAAAAAAVAATTTTITLPLQLYTKVEKPSNSSQNIVGKITKKELIMTLRNIELRSSSASFSFTSRHFPAFVKCYKMGKT